MSTNYISPVVPKRHQSHTRPTEMTSADGLCTRASQQISMAVIMTNVANFGCNNLCASPSTPFVLVWAIRSHTHPLNSPILLEWDGEVEGEGEDRETLLCLIDWQILNAIGSGLSLLWLIIFWHSISWQTLHSNYWQIMLMAFVLLLVIHISICSQKPVFPV